MRTAGCFGLMAGTLAGLLLVMVLILLLRSAPPPPVIPQAPTVAPDITIFMSERSLSRIASEAVGRPVAVDFDTNGHMQITTQTHVGPFEPVIHIGVVLGMEGAELTSRLRWLKLGFLTIPARWLPQEITDTVTSVGQAIQNQAPPDFILLELTTTPAGIEFGLKWVGQ